MTQETTKANIETGEQITFSKGEGFFIGIITETREKAVKVDYCWKSVWNNCQTTVYNYTTWIPKSVITHNEFGYLTVKKWFAANGLNAEKIYHIKKYFIGKDGNKVYA